MKNSKILIRSTVLFVTLSTSGCAQLLPFLHGGHSGHGGGRFISNKITDEKLPQRELSLLVKVESEKTQS